MYLAPVSILTGYFGMNFDNMPELTYPYINSQLPGKWLMWSICLITYGFLLLYSIHYRIIYSAT